MCQLFQTNDISLSPTNSEYIVAISVSNNFVLLRVTAVGSGWFLVIRETMRSVSDELMPD